MRIIEPQSAVLSNAEVLAHLQEIATKRRAGVPENRALKSPNFETVVKELTASLAPAGNSPVPEYGTNYSAANIHKLVHALSGFGFTKAELIMILNLRPQEPVFLDIIIEECDNRLDSNQQEKVLDIIGDILGREQTSEQ